jgi:hypothetical protein
MNRERNGKLLTLRDSGANSTPATGEKPKQFRAVRPDGGVVTQRTANPLTVADFRDSWTSSRSVRANSFQWLRRASANRASAAPMIGHPTTTLNQMERWDEAYRPQS